MKKEVYSLCFMCSVRCPIKVTVENDQVKFIEGSPHVAGIEGSICPRGAAGIGLVNDHERVQHPMIRTGPRGAGQWRKASWEEALDYVADKLKDIVDKHGPESVAFGERVQLSTPVAKTLMAAIGSPNHFCHDALCRGSIRTATNSVVGCTVTDMSPDYQNTKQIVFYGRNFFESIEVKGVKNLTQAMENGAKVTYIDPRVTVTATKAHRYWRIRPGTDLALNYALIHVILAERLYDIEYVDRWAKGLTELQSFVRPYTPQWAEKETGIPAQEIVDFAREVSRDKPAVIFHFGYRGAHHTNEVYMRRSILILNALMGSYESKGGLYFKKGPEAVGGVPPRKLTDLDLPKVDIPRFDKVGTPEFPLPELRFGVAQMLPYAILNEDPNPLKALFIHRFEPLLSMPDTTLTRKAFDKLDLIVTIEINYSDTAWYSDVILPEPTYLERLDPVQQANGLKPQLFLSSPAVKPRYDSREGTLILKQIGERLGLGEYFPYDSMEDYVRWQLEPTGFKLEDFAAKGFVSYTDKQIIWDRKDGIKFKTPSGKIEFVSSMFEDAGFESLPEYEPMPSPPENQFRLVVGRCALHTHISTQNNPYLNEIVSKNVLWINTEKANTLRIRDGDLVEVSSKCGSGKIKAFVTDLIHPEAVFMLHGFGHQASLATRSLDKGMADSVLQENISDMVGGSPALHHTFVTVKPA
ncbi:MAG TPA: molybdopterin-dependent oxidoreductase [Desulfobacterales bacterium]|nr:molybdopterin-dependent oxidoreductase [Desulfobacterales bacterium]